MALITENFEKCSTRLDELYWSFEGNKRKVWVDPEYFCAGIFNNDPGYHPGDEEPLAFTNETSGKSNANFEMNESTLSHQRCSRFTVIAIMATSNINRGDEIFASSRRKIEMDPNEISCLGYQYWIVTLSTSEDVFLRTILTYYVLFVAIRRNILWHEKIFQEIPYGTRNVVAISRCNIVMTSWQRLNLP